MGNNHKNLQKEIDKALNKSNVDKDSIIKQSEDYTDTIFTNLKEGNTSDLKNININGSKRKVNRITPDNLPTKDSISTRDTLKLFWGTNWTSILFATCCFVFFFLFYYALPLNVNRFFMATFGIFFFLLARYILLSSPYYDVPYYFSDYFDWYEKLWNNTVSKAKKRKIWIIGTILYCLAVVITFIPYISIIVPFIEIINTIRYWSKNKGYIQLRLLKYRFDEKDITYGIVTFFSVTTRLLFYIWYFCFLLSNIFHYNIMICTLLLMSAFIALVLFITLVSFIDFVDKDSD